MFRFIPFFLVLVLLAGCSTPNRHTPPNVVLISLDTLRADHLGCYGYARNTSPNIDRFAAESIVFQNAFSTAPKTAESHMSMFTSLYPSVHQVYTVVNEATTPLDKRITTLAQILKGNGFKTVGFHDGGHVRGELGFSRGFDIYRYHQGNQEVAENWIKKNGLKQKFFLFYHTYQVHDPYTPTEPYDKLFDPDYSGEIIHDKKQLLAGRNWAQAVKYYWDLVDKNNRNDIEHLIALYDGEIAEMDAKLGRLFSTIDNYSKNTIVIVLADHGEEFGDHGKFKHDQFYNELIRVPLIIRFPDKRQGILVKKKVSLIDLAPTILALESIPAIGQFQGESFLDGRNPHPPTKAIFSEWPRVNTQSLIFRRHKVIYCNKTFQYYDLKNDFEEQNNLTAVKGEQWRRSPDHVKFGELKKKLYMHTHRNQQLSKAFHMDNPEQLLSQETLDELKALGYLN